LRDNHPDILDSIKTTGDLSDETVDSLSKILDDFVSNF